MVRWMLLALAFFTCLASTEGRLIPDWPYEKLVRDADLVVLAVPEASTDSDETPAKEGWRSFCANVNTTLRVLAPLKGKAVGKLTLSHYRLKGNGPPNGPCLVRFLIPAHAEAEHGG